MGNSNSAGGSKVVPAKNGGSRSLETYILDESEEDRVRQALGPLLVSLGLSLCGEIRLGANPKGKMTISGVKVTALPVTATY